MPRVTHIAVEELDRRVTMRRGETRTYIAVPAARPVRLSGGVLTRYGRRVYGLRMMVKP